MLNKNITTDAEKVKSFVDNMTDNMGVSRHDKQQPIIIQNLDLLLPGKLKSKRKPLSTANLYLSAASFRRQGGTAVIDDSTRLQNSNSCSCMSDDMCNVNDHQKIPGFQSVQSPNPNDQVLETVPGRSHLNQPKQTSLLDTTHNTRLTRTNQMFRSATTYQDAGLMPSTDTSTDTNQDNTISDKINFIRQLAGKDKLVQEIAPDNTSVINQKSPLHKTNQMKAQVGREDKTTCEDSLSFKVNHSQASFQLSTAERLSGKERSSNYFSIGGYVSDDARNSKSQIKDKTISVEDNETMKDISNTRGTLLSVCEESKMCTKSIDVRPTSDVCSEHCTQKGERPRTKTKRVSFKLPFDDNDGEDKCFSKNEICVQKLVDTSKWDIHEMSSAGDPDGISQYGTVEVYTSPQLVDTDNVAAYRSRPPVHSPAIHVNDNLSYKRTRKCTKTILLRAQPSSRGSRRSSGSSEFHDFHVNEQVLKDELVTKQSTEGDSYSTLTTEVTSLENVSQQHRRCEQFREDHNNSLHNKLGADNIDYGISVSDEVYVASKSGSKKPEAVNHVDIDSILMKPKTLNHIHKHSDLKKPNIGNDGDNDVLSISNNQSDANTDYLKRIYSNHGDAVLASSHCNVFDTYVNPDTTRLPEENLTNLSRHVGYINRSRANIYTDHPNTKRLQVSGQDRHFSARLCGEAGQPSSSRSHPVSIKDKTGVKDSMTYVDRYLFQIDRGENVRTLMNKRLENLIVSNLRQHRQNSFLESSRASLL